MATPRTQQENPEAAYAATRDKAIETFIQDPTYGKGVSVRKAGAGTREFTYDGGSVYTWSADQEKADREADTSVDSNKTFAELLTTELPSRLARAKQMWASAGDAAGAKAELDALDKFARDNRDTLRTLTRYQGQDDLAKDVAEQARDLVSGAYRLEFATMGQDAEIKAKVAQKQALDMGLDAESADVYKRMVADKDPEAIALWNASGAPAQAEPRPGAAGKGATPQAARAAAAGIDPADIKGFIGYAKTAGAKLAGNIEKPVLDLMPPDDRAKALRMSYDSGDKESGGIVLDTAARVARAADGGTDGRGKLNAFQSALVASNEAMQAWGDAGDPVRRAMGVKIMASLADSLPGTAFVSQKQQVVGVMKSVSSALDQYRNLGVDFDEKKASVYARAVYNRTYRPAVPLSGEEALMADVMTKANMYGGNITVSRVSADPAKGQEDKSGYDILAGVAREHVQGAAAAAMANGTSIETEMASRSLGLAQTLRMMGVADAASAESGAKMLSELIAGGKEVDIANMVNALGQSDLLRDLVGRANAKDVQKEDMGAAVPVDLEATTPDLALRKNINNVDVRTRDLAPGAGDVRATERAFVSAVAPTVTGVVLEGSPMFKYLFTEVPTADLDKPEVRESAVARVMDAYARVHPTAASGSDPAALRAFAEKHVSAVISNLATEADKVGRSSNLPLSSATGVEDAEVQRRLAAGRLVVGAAPAVVSSTYTPANIPSKLPVSPENVAKELADVFFADIKAVVPEGQRGFGMAAKTKIRNLSVLPPPVAAKDKPVELSFNIARVGGTEGTRAGFLALKQVSDKLGKPIKDAAVRKLVTEDIPRLMDGMPSSAQLRGRLAAKKMADDGRDVDEIMAAFEKSFGLEEVRAAKAMLEMKAAEIKLRNQAAGIGTLGGSDEAEAAPGTK